MGIGEGEVAGAEMREMGFRPADDPDESFFGRDDQQQSGSESQKDKAKEDERSQQIAHRVKGQSPKRERENGGRFEKATGVFRFHGGHFDAGRNLMYVTAVTRNARVRRAVVHSVPRRERHRCWVVAKSSAARKGRRYTKRESR